ncbi:hypothetical protein HY389_01195 [Candidatus Daviesbacteria bacterium]|nr:hypothetical protein [Candidatus Daviesbacteria bacterium]
MKFVKIFLVVIFVLIFAGEGLAKAQTATDQQLQSLQDQISQLQQQLAQTRDREKSLKSQLEYIDNQTKLTQLKIDQANYQIAKLTQEIADLGNRIVKLSTTVDSISQVLLNRIVQTYKFGDITPLDLLFSSNGFSDMLERLKYLEVAQANDKKVLYQLQATKAAYNDQKTDRQTREAEQQKLKKDLQVYQQQLGEQKQAKNELLRLTQNDEAVYQAKLQAALAEQQAIISILNGGGNEVVDGQVNQGDVIGHVIIGRSACSSGTHLHFEVHSGGAIQDPNNYLSNTSFQYEDNDNGGSEGAINPHGSWAWPMDPQIYITQGFGMTPTAKLGWYGGGPHTGIDLYSSSGSTVKAVRAGKLSHGGIACGGGTLYYKKVDNGDGTLAYYLHAL